jgi:hypothetical protein
MKAFAIVVAVVLITTSLFAGSASAQPADAGRPQLHVNNAYSTCFFDLHPELTPADFEEFARQLGPIMRFRQLGDTTPLRPGKVDLSLQYTATPIDDTKNAWNNTMSHPSADHYLGDAIVLPRVVARFGVSDRVDVGAWGTIAPHSNYGIIGADTTVALVRQGPSRPVSVSIRPSASALLGPASVWGANASVDVTVGHAFRYLSPYLGGALSSSVAIDRRPASVKLDPATANGAVAYAGVSYGWRALRLSAEVEDGAMFSYGFRIGTRF